MGTGMSGALDANGITTGATINAGLATSVTADGTTAATDAVTVNAGSATKTIDVGNAVGIETTTVIGSSATTSIKVEGTAGTSDVANITVVADATVDIHTAELETVNLTVADGKTVTLADGSDIKTMTITSEGSVILNADSTELTTNTVTNSTAGLTIKMKSDAAADLSKVQFNTLNILNALAGDLTVASGANIKADVNLAANAIIATTETTDTLTLEVISDQTLLDFTDATKTIETVTINTSLASADADKKLTVTDLFGKKVILTGADKVSIGTAANEGLQVDELDASAVTADLVIYEDNGGTLTDAVAVKGSATAKNTVTFATTTGNTTYIGGSSNDTVTMAQTTGGSSVILGNGENTYTNTTLTDGSAVVIGGTGKDTVTFTVTDSGADTASIVANVDAGDDTVSINFAGADETATINLGAGNDTFKFVTTATGANDVITIDGGDGTDSIDLNGVDIDTGKITLSNIEIIDDSTGTGVVDSALLTGQTYTIKGNGNLATLLDVNTTTAGTYDFSGLVLDNSLTDGIGGLNITGNAGNDVITGTSGKDTIATNGGNDTITGGAGADTITLGAGNDKVVIGAGDTGKITGAVDIISAFKTGGTDTISFGGPAATVSNYVEAASTFSVDLGATGVARVATIEEVTAQANTILDGTVLYALIDNALNDTNTANADKVATDSYLFFDRDGDGTADEVVQFTGKVLTDIALTDIIA